MSAITYAIDDLQTMVGRVLKHTRRNPSTLIMTILLPLVVLLLFNYGFGGALDTGGVAYIDYVVPGIILMGAGYSASATAVAVSTDMSEGIIDRFRTMAISRASVLSGHVIGSTLRTFTGIALVVAIALPIGFRPTSDPLRWLAAVGLVVFMLYAVAWLATGIGLFAGNASGAASMASLLSMLPFLSGAFVPVDTMPGWLQVFTANQPMTHIEDALRGLLMDAAVGDHGWISLVWLAGITLVGYLWSRSLFNRKTAG
ncbi:ABC transporter permease [Actinomadura bangladeshensis]|uniref:ABC transporter permease n=1 Tax=Actinomadura bangladeshensis TaxID=453573 RepID=UPI001942D662|nr:ABC transporter permease [Actinomadura bangladeshensis]